MTRSVLARLLLLLALAPGCDDNAPRPDPPIAPTPVTVPPPVVATRVEYRVTGSHRDVTITYTSSTQGTTVIRTDLPWFLTYDTLAPHTFVYLQAAGSSFNTIEGPLIVQVFVNGALFREARGNGLIPVVEVSGEVIR
jgi:hypothetical protein